MTSTFHALETARRGMMTQRYALHTTGHNIANANTPGYSVQRVNFVQTEPYPAASINRPLMPGQLGTGVQAGSIQRMREQFLDVQFRNENNKTGYWSVRYTALEKMEDIMNEPSEEGLSQTIDRFWQSLQDLAVQPEDAGARAVVRQRGIAVAETFNFVYNSLTAIRNDLRSEIETMEKEVNSLLRQINTVNKQIGESEPHGYVTNDLYDERDRLVDQLSSLVNIKVEHVKSKGNPDPVAEGKMTIWLADSFGNKIGDVPLIDGNDISAVQGLKVNYTENGLVRNIGFGPMVGNDVPAQTGTIGDTIEGFSSIGRLKGIIEAYGYGATNGDTPLAKGLYPEMLANLDEMAFRFATEFNKIHETGWSISEINNGKPDGTGVSFFRDKGNDAHNSAGILTFNEATDKAGFAARIGVANQIKDSLDHIAASGSGQEIYAPMKYVLNPENEDDANPGVAPIMRGVFTGIPTDNGRMDEINISVSFTEGEWSFIVTNPDGEEIELDEEIQFNGSTLSLFGLTIDATDLNLNPENSYTWELNGIKNGTKAEAFTGDGSNALRLSNMKDVRYNFSGSTANVQSFYRSVIGDMAVDTAEALRMRNNSGSLRESVQTRRDAVSNVSLDEEMTNMIMFQHAYNAAARNITLVDEMLDRIINGMGLVGR